MSRKISFKEALDIMRLSFKSYDIIIRYEEPPSTLVTIKVSNGYKTFCLYLYTDITYIREQIYLETEYAKDKLEEDMT